MNDHVQQSEERLARALHFVPSGRINVSVPASDLRWLLDERKTLLALVDAERDLGVALSFHPQSVAAKEAATRVVELRRALSASVSVEQAEAYVCSGGDSHLPACGGTCGTFETLEQAGGGS